MDPREVQLTVLFALVACAPDLSENRSVAEVETPPAAAAAAVPANNIDGLPVPALTAGKVLPVNVAQSSLGGIGAKVTATHPLRIGKFAGTVGLDADAVSGISFAADMGTIEADHPKLTAHLKDEDFLAVAQFPHATFVSTEVKPGGADGNTHTVTGDLTIRGQTKRVSFPATITVAPEQVTAKTEFVINRKDFGVQYPGRPDDLVQDNVVLQISFVAPRA